MQVGKILDETGPAKKELNTPVTIEEPKDFPDAPDALYTESPPGRR